MPLIPFDEVLVRRCFDRRIAKHGDRKDDSLLLDRSQDSIAEASSRSSLKLHGYHLSFISDNSLRSYLVLSAHDQLPIFHERKLEQHEFANCQSERL